LSEKPGNVREVDSCQGNVRNFTKNQGNVKKKNIVREKLPKLFILNCIFASIQDLTGI